MTTAPNLVVAGHLGLSQKLRDTERFPAVFEVSSATELRALSQSGKVRPPAAVMIAPELNEDLSGIGVPDLADGLVASGFTVLVHSFFTKRGDVFGPGVLATTEPMSLSDLLTALGAVPPASPAPADLHPEPPPEPWAPPGAASAESTGPRLDWAAVSEAAPPGPVQPRTDAPSPIEHRHELPDTPAGYGELSIVHHGAAAVTYRAVHEESGTVVALRVRHDGAETAPEELAALQRASRNDDVCTLLESGRSPTGRVYTASAYAPSGAHTPGSPLPFQDAVRIAASAGRGLQALHEEGLVHGDVHPGRIMGPPESPLLTGTATLRGLAAHSAPGVLEPVDLDRVDPAFAAPEVLRSESPTAASDVYGLGATLWSLLAGHAPFTGPDRQTVREQALNGTVSRVPGDAVPEWLADVLAHATAHRPADRYPTARAFTAALEQGLRVAPTAPTGGEETDVLVAPLPLPDPHDTPVTAAPPSEPPLTPEPLPDAQDTPVAPAPPPAQEVPTEWPWEETATAPGNAHWGQEPPPAPYDTHVTSAPPAHPQDTPITPAPPPAQEVPTEWPWEETATVLGSANWGQEPPPAARPGAPGGRGGRRKPVLAAVAVLVLLAAGIGVAGLVLDDGAAERRPQAESSSADPSPAKSSPAEPSQAPESTPTAVRPAKEFAPGDVRILDGKVSIQVTWKDRSRGRAAYYVVGGPMGRPPSTLASAQPGAEKVSIAALNPGVNYCLTVVAVVDVDRVSQSKPVCTRRVQRGG